MIGNLVGAKIIYSPMIGKPQTITRIRTTKERWLSWPWRPWRKIITEVKIIPGYWYDRHNNVYYVNTALKSNFERAVKGITS